MDTIPFETTLEDAGLESGLSRLTDLIGGLADTVQGAADRMAGALDAVGVSIDSLTAQLGLSVDGAAALADASGAVAAGAASEAIQLDVTSVAAAGSATAHDLLGAAMDRVGAAAARVGGALGGFASGLGNVLDGLAGLWMPLGLVAGGFDLAAVAAIHSGASFQQAMMLVATLAANAQDNVGQLTQYLISVAGVWGQTPTDLANALYYVMSAGYHGATALDVLKESSYAASGGLGSILQMAKGVTTLMTDFGLSSKQAADIVVTAVTAGKVSVDDFVNSIGKWGPTAQQTGYDVVAAATAFDTLTRAGINANTAGTYLRSTMLQIGDRALTLQQQAQALGFTIDATTLQMIKQGGGANALRDQLKYIEDQTRNWANANWSGAEATTHYDFAIQKLFGGIRSGQGAIGLSINDFSNLDAILTQTTGNLANTTALDHYNQVMQGLSGAGKQLHAALSAVKDALVVAFGPSLVPIIKAITDHVQRFADWISKLKPAQIRELGVAFLVVAGVLNGLFAASLVAAGAKALHLTELLRGVGPVAALFGGWGSHITGFIGPLAEGETRARGLIGGLHTLGDAGVELGARLGGAPAAAVKGLVNAWAGLPALGPKILGTFETIRGGLGAFGSALGDGMLKISDFAMRLDFHPTAILGGLKNLATGGFGLLRDAIVGGLPALGALAGGLGAILLPVLLVAGAIAIVVLAFTVFHKQTMQVVGVLGQQVRPILQDVGKLFGAFVGQIRGAWQEHGPAITAAMDKLFAALKQMGPTIQVVGTVLKVVIGVILTVLGGLVSGFLAALPSIIGFFTALFGIINDVSRLIIAIFTGQWGKIPGIIGDLFGHVRDLIENALGVVLSFIGGFVNGALGLVDKFTGGFLQKIGLLPKQGPIHVAEMKVQSLTHLEQMQTQGVKHLEDLKVGILKQLQETKDPAKRHMLEMKLAVIQHQQEMEEKSVKHTEQMRKKMLDHLADLKKNGIQHALDFASGVVSNIGSFFGGLPKLAEHIWRLFQGTIQLWIDKAKKTIDDWIFNAKQSLNNMISDVTTIGTNIIQGLINGIDGMVGNVQKEIDKIGNLIPSGLKHLFGISSPSAVFAEIGANMGEGLMAGLIGQNLPARVAAHLAGLGGRASAQITANVASGGASGAVVTGALAAVLSGGGSAGGGGVTTPGRVAAQSGGGLGGGGTIHIDNHLHLDGNGWQLLSAAQRRDLAQVIADELGDKLRGQRIGANGYSGFP